MWIHWWNKQNKCEINLLASDYLWIRRQGANPTSPTHHQEKAEAVRQHQDTCEFTGQVQIQHLPRITRSEQKPSEHIWIHRKSANPTPPSHHQERAKTIRTPMNSQVERQSNTSNSSPGASRSTICEFTAGRTIHFIFRGLPDPKSSLFLRIYGSLYLQKTSRFYQVFKFPVNSLIKCKKCMCEHGWLHGLCVNSRVAWLLLNCAT